MSKPRWADEYADLNLPMSTTKTQFTPGPWTRDIKGNLRGANGEPIYFKGADADLMTAAPELLRELHVALAAITSPNSFDIQQLQENWTALIRKAKGE